MGLLGEIYSTIDSKKRQLKGLLSEPVETIRQGLLNFRDDQNNFLNLAENAYPGVFPGSKTVLNTPEQVAWMRKQFADKATDMAFAAIVPPNAAQKLNTIKNIPGDDLFRQAVSNTPGAKISDDGLLMMVQRNQNPDQGMRESVRGGVFYLPAGAAQGKHYSTGRNGYGGTEKISGETLVSNPLFVKGATGGKAPESAYDQLVGKGAYQAMRNDALKTYGRFGVPDYQRVELVSEFLQKYAPELEDQAANIVAKSKQGNQLAYALQEAAAGSAARKAGYDSILGYSKGKNGPFLSELFDVRESHYPDKFGGYRIWDEYKKGLLD